jgi:5-methylcytosine-specific restriction protein A
VIYVALKKLCSWRGCSKICNVEEKYCNYHQEKFIKVEQERYKEYSKRRREDKEQKKYQEFYNSSDWKRVRDAVISSCNGMDIIEYYRAGKIVQGERVHHIVELDDDWNCRLDINNLIYLTEQNHRRVHAEYNKGEREKKQMKQILFGLLERWNKEFED